MNYENWKLEIVNDSYPVKLTSELNYCYFLENRDDEWCYLTHDMGGTHMIPLNKDMSEWVEKEYNIKIRENKLNRICGNIK
jgi:hypothetical protein